MKKYLAVFIVVFAVGASFFYFLNKNKMATPLQDPFEGYEVEQDFKDFYLEFMTDSVFQVSRINFPLEGLPSNASKEEIANGFYWQEEDWIAHKLINLQDGYAREFRNLGFVLIETIHVKEFGIAAQRRFKKDANGDWYLIYYAGLNRTSNEDTGDIFE